VLVVDVQARGDPHGDHPGAESAGGGARAGAHEPAVEDQADLVGASNIEVIPDDLLEEDPSRGGLVEHLGQGELGLQDRDLIPVAGCVVGVGEGVGQDRQPLVQQRLDMLRT